MLIEIKSYFVYCSKNLEDNNSSFAGSDLGGNDETLKP